MLKKYNKYKTKINDFFNFFNSMENKYITKKDEIFIKRKYKIIYLYFKYKIKSKKIRLFQKTYLNLNNYIQLHNSIYLKNQLNSFQTLLDNIDGKSLDLQQKMAVLCSEKNILVVAGAGSGKTLTISGKVKYLVESKLAKEEEILLILFTDKAVKEMTERLKKIDVNINAKTFHKLGLDILTNFRGVRPNIATSEFTNNIFSNYFYKEILNFPEQMKYILEFMSEYLYIPDDINNFQSLGDYIDYFRNIDYETLKSKYSKSQNPEKVSRLDDLLIANFLFFNNIKYIYNYPFKYKPEKYFYKKLKTNFFLPEYDIYLEHFSIDKNCKAKFLTKYEEQKYLEEINLKRDMYFYHNQNHIETYSYYNKTHSLLTNLQNLLCKNNVKFKKIDISSIYKEIYINQTNAQFDEFIKLISTFLSLFKSNNYQLSHLDQLIFENSHLNDLFISSRNTLFLKIFKNFYTFYEDQHLISNQIDFNDMINKSTDIVHSGFLPQNYKYIILDEYQDSSLNRFKLIKEIQKKCNSQVFCVGDDWQSIYRFSGSDIDLFSSFNKYFNNAILLKIEKNYRNSQELIDIASKFIEKNPNQLIKNLKSDKHLDNPLKVIYFSDSIIPALELSIKNIVNEYGENTDILLLGRTQFDISPILSNEKFTQDPDTLSILYTPIPTLNLKFLTIHNSKGLEADNVILLNMQNSMLGFPNRISNDPILSIMLNSDEKYDYAEERRLFYVAITRTKNATYLLAPEKKYSQFLEELLSDKSVFEIESEKKLYITKSPKCLKCQKGTLVLRNNLENNKEFLGCSNYPHCDYTLNDINILKNQIICKKCGGYIVEIKSNAGNFYGCSNYPKCRNALNK